MSHHSPAPHSSQGQQQQQQQRQATRNARTRFGTPFSRSTSTHAHRPETSNNASTLNQKILGSAYWTPNPQQEQAHDVDKEQEEDKVVEHEVEQEQEDPEDDDQAEEEEQGDQHEDQVQEEEQQQRKKARQKEHGQEKPLQHTSLKIHGDGELHAIDQNRERTHAVVAGRNTLKIVRANGNHLTEESNLRIYSTDRYNRDSGPVQRLNIHDVKWSHGQFSSLIATAATNGKVVIYDLARPGVEIAHLHEHSRQVHKLAFSPFQGHLLLSASQDGTVLLWDLRDIRNSVAKCSSRDKYKGQAEGVRDVKWSPVDATELAFCTDNGSVQKWEYRYAKSSKLRINAHDKSCIAIDWHPDGKHLLSAGQDKHVRIWDFASDWRRQRPQCYLRTPYPIKNACWRPEHCGLDENGANSWQCTQFAASYDRTFSQTVHLWDFRRPFMPAREICHWETAPADILWHSQRLLWSLTREGFLGLSDVQRSPKVIDRRPTQTFALSPTGEICVFSPIQASQPKVMVEQGLPSPIVDGAPAQAHIDNTEVCKRSSDEMHDDGLLDSSFKQSQSLLGVSRASKSVTSTPPSFHDSDMRKVARLIDTLALPQHRALSQVQISYRGFIDGTLDTSSFTYLAQKYKTSALPNRLTIGSYQNASKSFEQNAMYAEKTNSYRLAQTWRIFGAALKFELKERAEANRNRRLPPSIENVEQSKDKRKKADNFSRFKLKIHQPDSPSGSSAPVLLTDHKLSSWPRIEDSSRLSTPIARPQYNPELSVGEKVTNLPNPEQDMISLPPSIMNRGHLARRSLLPHSAENHSLQSRPTRANEWFLTAEINARKARTTDWKTKSNQPFEPSLPSSLPCSLPIPKLVHHDSEESFGMLSTSTGSGMDASASSHPQTNLDRSSMDCITESQHAREAGTWPSKRGVESHEPFDLGPHKRDVPSTGYIRNQTRLGLERTNVLGQGEIPMRDVRAENVCKLDYTFIVQDFAKHVEGLPLSTMSVHNMLLQVYRYYTTKSLNAQAVYHLSVMLKPLLTSRIVQPRCEKTRTGSSLAEQDPPVGGDIIRLQQEEAVLSTYDDLLQTLQIFNPSVALAREAYEEHEDLFRTEYSQVGFVCLSCSKPINNPRTKFRCENCDRAQTLCPICWQKYPGIQLNRRTRQVERMESAEERGREDEFAGKTSSGAGAYTNLISYAERHTVSQDTVFDRPVFDERPDAVTAATNLAPSASHPILWQSCLVCGHGAHAACLQYIQTHPTIGGKCPTENCLCDCINGTYRIWLNQKAEQTRHRLGIGVIRGDSRSVAESKAVKSTRDMLVPSVAFREHGSARETVKADERRVRVVKPQGR